MSLTRFFLGLGLLATASLIYVFLTDTLAGSDLAFTAGEVAGKVLGSVMLGLLFWAPLRIGRGADKAPDVRSFSLKAAAIIMAGSMVYGFFVGTPVNNRIQFLSSFNESCLTSQRKLEENSSFSDAQLSEFCSCISSQLSNELTEEDIKLVGAEGVIPDYLQKKFQNLAASCGQDLLQKWGSKGR